MWRLHGTDQDTIQNATNCDSIITNNPFTKEVKLYPNPTNGPIKLDLGTIKEEEVSVQIYTIEGKLIINKNFDRTNRIDLNVDDLFGFRLVIIHTESGKVASFKLVEQ